MTKWDDGGQSAVCDGGWQIMDIWIDSGGGRATLILQSEPQIMQDYSFMFAQFLVYFLLAVC